MEDVLDVYHLPYEKSRPVVCMDEQPVQFLKETRMPIPAAPGQPAREDYEYERNGTGSVFLFTEALQGWRQVSVRDRRTAVDWAQEVKELLDVRYAEAEKVLLVMDNLNTHSIGSLYEAFDPIDARRLAQKLEIHHTPKHGSWLNVAECELSAFTRQCSSRRMPDRETLQREAGAWADRRNRTQKGVDWHLTIKGARIKLKRLYPQIQS
jgi:hypothetical protein